MTGLILAEINCLKDCCQVSNVALSTPISITSFGLCFSSSEIPIIIVPPTEFAKAIISFTKLFLLFSTNRLNFPSSNTYCLNSNFCPQVCCFQ